VGGGGGRGFGGMKGRKKSGNLDAGLEYRGGPKVGENGDSAFVRGGREGSQK